MNALTNKKNLTEFTYLRAIGIFLVVLGHSFPNIDEINFPIYKYIHSLIYSFHMPLFFMISGFFAQKILYIDSFRKYKSFIIEKFNKLIVPYLTISFLTIPIKYILNNFAERNIVISEVIKDIFLYPWNNPIIFFWFIYVLFLIFVISPLLLKLNKFVVLTSSLILSVLPIQNIQFLGITTILKHSIFFFIGIYFRGIYMLYRHKFLNLKFNIINLSTFIMVLFLLSIIKNSTLYLNKNLTIIASNISFVLKAFLGIYICFFICVLIYKFFNQTIISSILTTISKYSFDIYLLSWFTQIFTRIIFYQVLNLNYTLVVILSLISGFIPIIISKFILRKYKLTKRLLLGIV